MKVYKVVVSVVGCILMISGALNAQNFQFSVGRNLSEYHLINSNGQEVDYLKPGSGMHVKAAYTKAFLDTLAIQISDPEKALKYTQSPLLSKVLSVLNYSIALQMLQVNAIGDIQQIPLKYETDYVGVECGLGAKFNLLKNLAFQVKGLISANKMIYGSQMTGNNFYLLKGNSQFDGIKLFKGIQFDIRTQINPNTEFVLGYGNFSTLSPAESSTGKLDFSTQLFSLGFALQFKK